MRPPPQRASASPRSVSAKMPSHARAALLGRHPYLVDFLESPSTVLVRVRIDHWYVVDAIPAGRSRRLRRSVMSEAAPLTATLSEAGQLPVALVGGKARSLGVLLGASLPAIDGIVITTAAFRAFVAENALSERVALEFARRPLDDMRDEELWDASTRIRSAFQAAPWPLALREEVVRRIEAFVAAGPLVVRSSSPQEDSDERSFAGLHDSVIGVEGLEAALAAVATVWSSLYSERALMYRAELGFDVARAAMAVVVQPLATSERSGITFTGKPGRAGRRRARGGVGARRGAGERAHRSGPLDDRPALGCDPCACARASRPDHDAARRTSRSSKRSLTAVASRRRWNPTRLARCGRSRSAPRNVSVHPRTASGPTTAAARCWSNRAPSPRSPPTHARHGRVPSKARSGSSRSADASKTSCCPRWRRRPRRCAGWT